MSVQTTGPGAGRGGTRERILVLLRRHGQRSAPELAAQLGLSVVGVRRHLTTLERDGLVDSFLQKPQRGRPAAAYRLTDAGRGTFPRHDDEVAHEALSFLGAGDGERLRAFLAWRNQRLAARYGARLRGRTTAERAGELAEALSEQGFMAEVEPAEEGLRLCQHHCTIEHLAAEHPDVCASETALFQQLLGTAVVREATIVGGAVRCVTHVPVQGAQRRRPRGADPAAPARPSPTASRSS